MDLLVNKLFEFGIDNTVLKFIKNFLIGRFQCVVYKGVQSGFLEVTSGVPQGTVLDHFCFLFISMIF